MQNSSDKILARLGRLAETDILPVPTIDLVKSLLDFTRSIETADLARFTAPKPESPSKRTKTDQLMQLHAIVGCDIGKLATTIPRLEGDSLFILAPSIGSASLLLENIDLATFFAPMQVHLFIEADLFLQSLKKEQNFWKKINLWLTPLARKKVPQLCDKISDKINICNKIAANEVRTLNRHYFNWAKNENRNLRKLACHAHTGTSRRSALSGSTALLVGAGPSLQAALPFLKKIKKNNQVLIIAASTVLRVLEKEEVTPHLTIIIEGERQKHFSTLSKSYIKRLRLLAALQTNPAHLNYPFKEIYWFHHQTSATVGLVELLLPEATATHCSGNVITDGLRLALSWGCATIALCGCDMAYSATQKYLAGLEKKESEQEETVKNYFPVPGQQGETLYAPTEFISYAQGLENITSILKTEGQFQKIYNLSRGGRHLIGTIEESPEEFYKLTLNLESGIKEKLQQHTTSWRQPTKDNLTQLNNHHEILAGLYKTLHKMQKNSGNPLTKTAQINIVCHLLEQLPEFCNSAAQIMIPWMRRLHVGGRAEQDIAQLTSTVASLYEASQATSIHESENH